MLETIAGLLLYLSPIETNDKQLKQVDHICYMVKSDGEIINLEYICQRQSNQNIDQLFINEYQKRVNVTTSGQIKEILLRDSANNPTRLIQLAKGICQGLREGKSREQLISEWIEREEGIDNPIAKEAGRQTGIILFTIAPRFYCP